MIKYSPLEDCLTDLSKAVTERNWKVFNSEKERYLDLVEELGEKRFRVCLTAEGVLKMQDYYLRRLEKLRDIMLEGSKLYHSSYSISWMGNQPKQ